MDTVDSRLLEYTSRKPRSEDGLFLERLEAFKEKCLADIKAFSDRELRPFEETRRSIAEWHAKYLFQPCSASAHGKQYAHFVMIDTSRILENLAEASGVHSFFLAVDPHDVQDPGFLGGSLQGREFWRNLRGGGEQGAKAFKQHCLKTNTTTRAPSSPVSNNPPSSRPSPQPSTSKQDAKSVKAELYDTVRQLLRSVSGIRTAEMKWTNHERLDAYGVQLVGWPQSLPTQNPSTLKLSQNKLLLESFKNGIAKFERLSGSQGCHTDDTAALLPGNAEQEAEDFSWAYDADGLADSVSGDTSASVDNSKPATTPASTSAALVPPTEAMDHEPSNEGQIGVNEVGFSNLYDPWTNFDPSSLSLYESESHPLEWFDEETRYRKRPRRDEDNDVAAGSVMGNPSQSDMDSPL